MQASVNDNPNALSSKRPHVITSPEVERALILKGGFQIILDDTSTIVLPRVAHHHEIVWHTAIRGWPLHRVRGSTTLAYALESFVTVVWLIHGFYDSPLFLPHSPAS